MSSGLYADAKRALDIVIAGGALVALLPFLAVIMVILRLTGEGEVFFKQRRLGHRNREFDLWKFVTMLKDSPKSGTLTSADDPRILPVGRFLRRTKINELPQLWNVLKGDMSIVGPRPLTPETFSLYPEHLKSRVYHSKPGLTGIGSVAFRNEEDVLSRSPKPRYQCYREEVLPLKGALEVWYQHHRSFALDLRIILLTAIAMARPGEPLYRRWFRELPATA